MIIESEARNGDRVVYWQGRSLCSRHDPSGDAEKWVSSQSALTGSNQIILVGLGSGHHLTKLLQRYPLKRIVVVEVQKDIINHYKQHYPLDSAKVDFVLVDTEGNWLEHRQLTGFLRGQHCVLVHSPSLQSSPAEFADAIRWLTGRIRESLAWLLKIRGWSFKNRQIEWGDSEVLSYGNVDFNSLETRDGKDVILNASIQIQKELISR